MYLIFTNRITPVSLYFFIIYLEAETSVDKQSDDMEDTIAEPLIRSPAVTFVKSYASNDTRLIPPANSSTLQNVAFLVLPNSGILLPYHYFMIIIQPVPSRNSH